MSKTKHILRAAAAFVLLVLAGLFLLPQHIHIPEEDERITVSDGLRGGTVTFDDPAQVERIVTALSDISIHFRGFIPNSRNGSFLYINCYDSAGELCVYIRIQNETSLGYCGTLYRADLSELLPLIGG